MFDRRGAISGLSLPPFCPTCTLPYYRATGSRRTTSATDDFSRPDGMDLGAEWEAGTEFSSSAELVMGRVRNISSPPGTSDSIETFNADLPGDQWASIVLASFGGTDLIASGPTVRWAMPPARSGYTCRALNNHPSRTSSIERL
jgi:hypothetical protein